MDGQRSVQAKRAGLGRGTVAEPDVESGWLLELRTAETEREEEDVPAAAGRSQDHWSLDLDALAKEVYQERWKGAASLDVCWRSLDRSWARGTWEIPVECESDMIEQVVPVASAPSALAARLPPGRRFALIGVAGFIAPKHLKAIRDTGNELVAAVDPHDSVGILDSYFPEARFFTEVERFDRFLEKERRHKDAKPVEFLTICSPNYLHDAHVRLALRVQANAICEKPLVINPWNLEQLRELEQESQRRVYTVLQLRLHPAVRTLKEALDRESHPARRDVCLTYVTRRGVWYRHSWKGSEEKSGGLVMNIGIHFFDLLLWLFGPAQRSLVHHAAPSRLAGYLELERARVRWFLSVDANDLPAEVQRKGGYAHRSIAVDGQELDLSSGFTDLHTEVYRDILAGGGFGIEDARGAIDLVHLVRYSREAPPNGLVHPILDRAPKATR